MPPCPAKIKFLCFAGSSHYMCGAVRGPNFKGEGRFVKNMKTKLCSLFACFMLLSPALVLAQGPGNNIQTVVPDGREESDSIPVGTATTYLFSAQAAHSYSVEQTRGMTRPIIPIILFGTCPANSPIHTTTITPQ